MTIVVREVAASVLSAHSISLDMTDAAERIEKVIASEGERWVKIPLIESGVEVDAFCPQCPKSKLLKIVVGLT